MRRVLFVDDEPRILEGLRRMLRPQRAEWDMAFAPGGAAALALMEATPFDVIVSDMRMPGIDGAALLTRVRDLYPEVVRIVLSGHTEMATALQVVPVAHQFLAKPCDAEMLRVGIERACHLKGLLHDEAIRRTVGAVGDIPSIPRIYEALTNALMDADVSLAKIAKIVEQDVGICAKILQLVNSAFFGISHSMTNIQNAVSYLGINTLRSLVLSVEIFRTFTPQRKIEGFSLEAMHRHAQLTAQIARRLPMPKHLIDIAMVAGMLHDVGKLILAWKLPDRFEKALMEASASQIPLYQAEERLEGFGHAEIGAYLLGLWGLPYTVVEAVALHHRPNRVPHQGFDAISAVYAANLLAHGLEESSNGESSPYHLERFQEEINELGIGGQMPEWQAMVREIPAMEVEA